MAFLDICRQALDASMLSYKGKVNQSFSYLIP